MHSKHFKKMIAPIVITVILLAYLIVFASVFVSKLLEDNHDIIIIIFLGVVPLICAAISIYVLIERIKEIKKGENDDISKY